MSLIYFIKSSICTLIVLFLLYKYLKENQSIVQSLFTAFALKYFSIPFIGPTIDVLYLFSLGVSLFEIVSFLSGRAKVSKNMLLLFLLPFIFFVQFLLVYYSQNNHYLRNVNPIFWYIKTSASYIKSFLPYFFVGMAIKRQANNIELEDTFKHILKVATVSSVVALLQIFVFVVFYQHAVLLELLGLNGGYNYQYGIGGINLVRVQAFFYEPKSLAAFLGLAMPVAFFYKKNKIALLFLVVGFLTVSQTFFILLLAAFFLFIVLKKVRSIRASILWSIGLIIAFFFSISTLKSYLLENYASQEETIAYKIFLDRALQRYSLDDVEENRELLGIPLQADIELPAVNFLRDNTVFTLTGFGSGNYNTLPSKYFISEWNIDALEKGIFKGHFDMGWIYLIAELGILFFIILFFILTRINECGFNGRFYSYLWLVFFFHRIDFLLVAFFCLLFYKRNSSEDINRYDFI
jgi:hypothetical protein